MNELSVNNLHMLSQTLQQYKDLTLNGSKFFYYAYGKLDVKLQGILKSNEKDYAEVEELEFLDLSVKITFDELKKLTNRNRIQTRDIKNIIKEIRANSNITLDYDGKTEVIFIYKHVSIDSNSKKIEIEFNDDAIRLFKSIREMPFSNICFEDVVNLKTKYQINLYLYAISLLRGTNGNIQISLDKTREILAGDSVIDDYNFFHRFLNKPAKEITNNKNIKLKINANRNKKNIELNVMK